MFIPLNSIDFDCVSKHWMCGSKLILKVRLNKHPFSVRDFANEKTSEKKKQARCTPDRRAAAVAVFQCLMSF